MKGNVELPCGIIENVTRKNWENLFDNLLIFNDEYVYEPEVMKKFIKKLLKT